MNDLIARYAKIPSRVRWVGAAGIYVAVCILYYLFIHVSEVTAAEELAEHYAKLQTQQAEKKAYAENIAVYQARLEELQESLKLARNMLPDDAAVPEFLSQLGNKARQSGLSIDTFEPKAEHPDEFFSEIIFLMKVKGSYHEIATFIDAVGKLDRIVNVADISMIQPQTENKKIVVRGEFNVKTYRFISEEERKALKGRQKGKPKR